MPDEVYSFAVTIPAGTLSTAPATTAMIMPVRIVRRITVKIPPGPNGLMGFRVAAAGTQIIPEAAGTWIIASDEQIPWDVSNTIESGAFQLVGYNTGQYDHTVYVRFEVDLPPDPSAQLVRTPLRLGA